MPNKHLCSVICGQQVSAMEVEGCDGVPRTELDSHANMVVVCGNAVVVNETGRTVEVNAFSPELPHLTVKLVDAVVRYDCPIVGHHLFC